MDFNRAFQQYDALDGANCLTVGKRHLSQKEAAKEAVSNMELNQLHSVEKVKLAEHKQWKDMLEQRIQILKKL